MQSGQYPIYNTYNTLIIVACSSSTEMCVFKLIESNLLAAKSSVRCAKFTAEYKQVMISLNTHISVLDIHANVFRAPLQIGLEITLTVPLKVGLNIQSSQFPKK